MATFGTGFQNFVVIGIIGVCSYWDLLVWSSAEYNKN